MSPCLDEPASGLFEIQWNKQSHFYSQTESIKQKVELRRIFSVTYKRESSILKYEATLVRDRSEWRSLKHQ